MSFHIAYTQPRQRIKLIVIKLPSESFLPHQIQSDRTAKPIKKRPGQEAITKVCPLSILTIFRVT